MVRRAGIVEVALLTESKTCFLDWTVSMYVPGSTCGLEAQNRCQLARNKTTGVDQRLTLPIRRFEQYCRSEYHRSG